MAHDSKNKLSMVGGTKKPKFDNLLSIASWPICCLLVLVLGWSLLLNHLGNERHSMERFALKESGILAQAYADHLNRTFESIDKIALTVRFAWSLADGAVSLQQMAQKGLFPSTSLILVAVADAEGEVISSTQPLERPVSIRDREHFQVQRSSGGDRLFISKPLVGRMSGQKVIQFSRKMLDRQGNFAGVVVVSINPAYFVSAFESSPLGADGVLAVVGDDAAVRATRMGAHASADADTIFKQAPGITDYAGSMPLDGNKWFTDGRNRFGGWQRVPDYPFMAMVALDEEEQLGAYYGKRAITIKTGVLLSLLLLLLTASGTMSTIRLARSRRHAADIRQVYRVATEASSDGFYILAPVLDGRGAVVDFHVADCNERGAAILWKQRRDFLGKPLSHIYPARAFRRFMAILHGVMERGVAEDEFCIHSSDGSTTRWVHRRLVKSANGIAVTLRDVSDTKRHIYELERKGNEDALTRLHNRHWLHASLPGIIERARQGHCHVALLYIDIDGFKAVNDTMGHAAGDQLLQLAAARLESVIRPKDKAVRLGGDEFLLVLEDIRETEAAQIAARVVELLSEKFKLDPGMQSIGASVGISLYPKDGASAEELLQNADVAMYSAKQAGKGQWRFFSPDFYDSLRARLNIERRLRDAIEFDQFVMYYQPRVDMQTGQVTSLEALIRWEDPETGLVEPHKFIDIAEQTGLIVNVGSQVISKVCAQIEQWSRQQAKGIPVSINVSAKQFQKGGLQAELSAALQRHGLAPDMVEVEVTESSMMGDSDAISEEFISLQKLGIKVLVDDFGTGYSSLSQLQRLEMDGLKIDRSFTSELGKTRQGEIFFSAIVTMAHSLGMRVVAEGVETPEQARILKRLECDEIQGFYVSRPVPANDVPEIIAKPIKLAA
ncbi:bifunctional diguanylate cyclase/phosphodiesterase [Noviherbaspirillum humi]|nr:EAL domain-containing protein [Noviherbaspirillum humi]